MYSIFLCNEWLWKILTFRTKTKNMTVPSPILVAITNRAPFTPVIFNNITIRLQFTPIFKKISRKRLVNRNELVEL